MEFKFTIFTPTYNRAHTLGKLYESLKLQQFTDFEWIIVDDGSTDNTKELVDLFIKEEQLVIKYFYKKNEGKHIAINYGVTEAKGTWFFIVDSDDYLLEDTLTKVVNYCDQIYDNEKFAGVVGLRGNKEGKPWLNWEHEENINTSNNLEKYMDATAIEYRYGRQIKGDRAEIVKTEVMKKYPFPSIKNENFLSEKYLWMSIARDGFYFRWFNDVIYITEYLEEGLTKNIKYLYNKNSRGRCIIENLMITCSELPLKEKIKSCINYYRYGLISGYSFYKLYRECNFKYKSIFFDLIKLLKNS